MLTYNEAQLKSMIGIVEEIRDKIISSKNAYDEYVVSNLEPNWKTTSGIQVVNELKSFSNNNIQSFIDYLNQRISELYITLEQVQRIDVA